MEEALLLMNDANVINDEDLFLLHEANRPRNLHTGLPYWKYERFSLEDMRDDECEVEFRFKKATSTTLSILLAFLKFTDATMGWL